MNKLYCIIGESGSGKTSIVSELENTYNLKSIQSYTTRPIRYEGETGHIFVTDKEYEEMKDDIVAYTLFNGYRYWATGKQVETHQLYVVDYPGVLFLKQQYKGKKEIVSIYIYATEEQRKQRMLDRGDSVEKVEERIEHDRKAFSNVRNQCDYCVINNDLDTCVKVIYDIIQGDKYE
jgi:guanylate kinase